MRGDDPMGLPRQRGRREILGDSGQQIGLKRPHSHVLKGGRTIAGLKGLVEIQPAHISGQVTS